MIVLYPNADIINVRVNDEDIAAGIINFDTAVRIYEDTKKILTVTALDVIDPRPIHKGGKQVVTKFIESFKFGQTKVGSYIVPVICPLQEIDEREDKTAQLSLFSEESTLSNSFTRKVTTRFMDNLDKIRKCIEVSSEISFLTENNIGNIMSSNFLDVLLDFNNFGSSKSDISFKIYWSRKAEENRSEAIEVTLTKDINPILEAMSKKIKENVQPPDISIIGRIKELNAIPDIERREEGWAKIIYVDSQRSKTSKFKLDKSDYNLALDAHKRGLYVKVEGSIIDLEKKYYKALSFSVMEENCQDPVLF